RWCSRKKAASPKVSSTSCRASRPLLVTSHTRTLGSISRRGRRSCSTASLDTPGFRGLSARQISVPVIAVRRRPPEQEGGARFRDGSGDPENGLWIARRGVNSMAKSVQKITLSQSRDIPFNRLVLSQSNVRRIKAGVSLEELAQDIARRTLLQSLTVRPVLDGDGNETGMFEIPAGGRRYRALELLVQQKRLPRTAPIPCVVRTEGLAEEDSLAENVQRAPLHP